MCLGAVFAIGGDVSPLLDSFAHFAPFYLPAGLILVALTSIPSRRAMPGLRWPLLGLGVVSAAVSLWLVAPEFAVGLEDEGARGPTPLQLTVLTQNAWQGNTEIGTTVDAILMANADVVLLQELDGSVRDLPKRLGAAYPYHADCTVITEWCDLAILSKRPILSWTHHEPAWKPPEWDRLSLVEATIDGGAAGPVQIFTTHLMHPNLSQESLQQTHQFLAAVGDVDTRRGIIAGDFNRPPWSFSLKQIDRALPIARRTHGVFSWPNRLPGSGGGSQWIGPPFLPLDQIYAGRDWRVVDVKRAPATGSDHFGVMATLSLRPGA
jgi:endonuclease/exonuclease/phosphatase (EEP) superfamily protein YafD